MKYLLAVISILACLGCGGPSDTPSSDEPNDDDQVEPGISQPENESGSGTSSGSGSR
jgi:hypothetical protein